MTGSNIFSFLACKRAVVYQEIHGNRRLGNFLERNGLRIFTAAQGIADMDVCNTGNSYNGTDRSLFDFNLI